MKQIIKNWDNQNIIKTKNSDTIERRYLSKIGLTSSELDLESATQLFVLIIRDFKKGLLSLDELSSLGFFLFHKAAKRYPKSILFQATLTASELNFAIRNIYKSIPRYLDAIDAFYEQYSGTPSKGK